MSEFFFFFFFFEKRLDNLYYLEYLKYCPYLYCYVDNVSADVPFSLYRTSNQTLYLTMRVDCSNRNITRILNRA